MRRIRPKLDSQPFPWLSSFVQLATVKIENPAELNFILGQSHFVKTVEDIHEAMVQSVPGIKFGLAFCEASGAMLIRWTGTDEAMIELAKRNALALSAGHCFILFLAPGYFPINVLNTIKMVPEVCGIFCATANPVEVIVAETEQGRGILGVIDGGKSKEVEEADGIAWRKELLRKIGYKL
jgi:adenosine/AMP kinase